MTAPTLPAEGGCRCGAIRMRINAPPLLTAACHCTGCQRMTGSAYSLVVCVPTQGFELVEGEPVIGGLHGEQVHHFHCDHCKSWVFTRVEPEMGFVNVRATMLDDTRWFEPFVELWTSEKLPWVTVPAVHSYEGQPATEEFASLVTEYMGRQ